MRKLETVTLRDPHGDVTFLMRILSSSSHCHIVVFFCASWQEGQDHRVRVNVIETFWALALWLQFRDAFQQSPTVFR